MNTTLGRLLALSLLLAVAACAEPLPPAYYAAPAPPPLQPYMEPVAPPAQATKRVVKRRYVRQHRRVRCRCIPAS